MQGADDTPILCHTSYDYAMRRAQVGRREVRIACSTYSNGAWRMACRPALAWPHGPTLQQQRWPTKSNSKFPGLMQYVMVEWL